MTGILIVWFDLRGYGFIKPDDIAEQKEIFLHRSNVVSGVPTKGAIVTFEMGERGTRNQAVHVAVVSPATATDGGAK